ncbi:MAG: hypothetical protein QM811_22595 [Pirellulales bacterium]
MKAFTISFDLEAANEGSYMRIYEWAHRSGGYHYNFMDTIQQWGRLPTTCIIVLLNAVTIQVAAEQFRVFVEGTLRLKLSHYFAIEGTPEGAAWSVPCELPPEIRRIMFPQEAQTEQPQNAMALLNILGRQY